MDDYIRITRSNGTVIHSVLDRDHLGIPSLINLSSQDIELRRQYREIKNLTEVVDNLRREVATIKRKLKKEKNDSSCKR